MDQIPYRVKNKWGFCNSNRDITIKCVYDEIEPFKEGLALVKMNSKYGFINNSGQIAISLNLDYAKSFSEEVSSVKIDKKIGFINKYGEFVIDCSKYRAVHSFKDGYAIYIINPDSEWEFHGIINKQGENIVKGDFYVMDYFSEGMVPVHKESKSSTCFDYGFIDKTGNIKIPCIYQGVGKFSNDLAPVCLYDPNWIYKWGFINKQGEIIINFYFEKAGGFFEELARVRMDKKWGFINKQGYVVIKCEYEDVGDFSEGFASVKLNGLWGFINNKGEIVIACIFLDDKRYDIDGNTLFYFSENLACVKINNRWGFINKEGKLVIENIYDKQSNFINGFSKVSFKSQLGYINTEGIQYWED